MVHTKNISNDDISNEEVTLNIPVICRNIVSNKEYISNSLINKNLYLNINNSKEEGKEPKDISLNLHDVAVAVAVAGLLLGYCWAIAGILLGYCWAIAGLLLGCSE